MKYLSVVIRNWIFWSIIPNVSKLHFFLEHVYLRMLDCANPDKVNHANCFVRVNIYWWEKWLTALKSKQTQTTEKLQLWYKEYFMNHFGESYLHDAPTFPNIYYILCIPTNKDVLQHK